MKSTYSERVRGTDGLYGIVLLTLKEQQFFAKYSKREFWFRSVAFLGHIICSEGVEVDPKNWDAVKNWQTIESNRH